MTAPSNSQDFERLQEFLKDYDLADILAATADQAFREADALVAAGRHTTAAKLERLAHLLGDIWIPGLMTH